MKPKPCSVLQLATVAVTVAALIQPTALLAQRGTEPIVANATAEGAAAERSAQALNNYQKQFTTALGVKTAIPAAQMTALRNAATEAKREYQNLERAATSLMGKLKAANRWNAEFDQEIERRMKAANIAPEFVTYFRSQGGARAIIERHSKLATEAAAQLDLDINALTKKTPAQQALEAVLGAPVMAACIKCHCGWYALGAAVLLTVGMVGPAAGVAVGGLNCVSR